MSRIKQWARLVGSGGREIEVALCRAVAKDSSKQGGSHGDRCVRQQSAEGLPWRRLCDIVVMETDVSNTERDTKGEHERRNGGLLTVAASVVLQFVCVF